MSIRNELLAIQSASEDGILHCHEVVKWARDHPNSALHSAIEWDNDAAADAYRLWQVRRLVQLHITSGEASEQVVSLSIDRKAGGGYRTVSDVIARPDLREVMLQDALEELERVQTKYQRVEALASVWREAETVRARSGRRRRASVPAEQMAAAD